MHYLLARAVLSMSLCAVASAQASWSQLYPAASPPARAFGSMACHEATGEVVLLFGTGQTSFADAWSLQGATWTQMSGPLPPRRLYSVMVYDSVRQRLVLFGGQGQQGRLNDTWEWDGTSWTLRSGVMNPPARQNHGMAFDRERGVTVLFGGNGNGSATYLQDLWEWDGSAWVSQGGFGPAGRIEPVMAFDPVRRDVLMHGGFVASGTVQTITNDSWSWDGASWHQHLSLTPPPVRTYPRLVSDFDRQRVVLHGGNLGDSFAWEWDGAEWNIMLQASPGTRYGHGMAYDPIGRRVVVFGGVVGTYRLDDTWIYQTPTPADVEAFGSGCPGTAGTPELLNAPFSLPWIGDTHHNRVTNLAPTSAGAFFVTGFAATSPISLAPFGMPGCDQLMSPAIAEYVAATNGMAEWPLTIPNSMALANVQMFQQAIALDAGVNAAGLTVSNGVEITTGIR